MMRALTTIATLAALTTAVSAQTAAFKCPATGTAFLFKTGGPISVLTATGQDGDVCLYSSTTAGQTETVRSHAGLIGSVDAAGESYTKGIDLKSLWPLKVGNQTRQTVVSTGRDGKTYTTDLTMRVAAYQKVTVPAGTFDTFRVEEIKANDPAPRSHWWAPSIGRSVKEVFPDWTDRTKLKTYELTAVIPAAQ